MLRGQFVQPSLPFAEMGGSAAIEVIFHRALGEEYHTLLRGGAAEPWYQPWSAAGDPACIYYTHDYTASAFHEVAHWCIAGRARRGLADFGYWYHPDGRDEAEQQAFLQVEVGPQALESFFHAAWGSTFHPSFDNLGGEAVDPAPFLGALARQRAQWQEQGLPPRAARFTAALAAARRAMANPGPGSA